MLPGQQELPLGPNECPTCRKDMTIRAGGVYRCERPACPYWRIGFSDASPQKPMDIGLFSDDSAQSDLVDMARKR
jgi:hypothetical protein